jgi:outer membrane lipoprotein-sorting protein
MTPYGLIAFIALGGSCGVTFAHPNKKEITMKTLTILAALVLVHSVAHGQGMAAGKFNPASSRAARLFGKDAGFTATATTSTLDAKGTETITTTAYAVRDSQVRMEMDLTKTKTMRKGKPVKQRGDDTEGMAEMGMDQQVILVLPDKQATYLVYPKMKAYCLAPKTAEVTGESKTEWKEIGTDTVDGHPCVKYEVTTTKADGTTEQLTAWKATDLNNFIIQTVTVENGETTTMKFADIKHEKPPAAMFELPADYTKYGSMQEMMMGAMQRMMQNMGGQ